MSNFQGISLDGMFLLAENRFRDSKSFYEEQKPQIKKLVLDPLRDLAEDLAGPMLAVDSRIITDPNRNGCISRIRRDNRYTHDKSMYREKMCIRDRAMAPIFRRKPPAMITVNMRMDMRLMATTDRRIRTQKNTTQTMSSWMRCMASWMLDAVL